MEGPRLEGEAALAVARALVDAAGLAQRVEATLDPRGGRLLVCGPESFGLFGSAMYRALPVPLPATRKALAVAVARHALEEFHATEGEILDRAAEVPLGLAVALTA